MCKICLCHGRSTTFISILMTIFSYLICILYRTLMRKNTACFVFILIMASLRYFRQWRRYTKSWRRSASWTTHIWCTLPTTATIWVNSAWSRGRASRSNSTSGYPFWFGDPAWSQALCKYPYNDISWCFAYIVTTSESLQGSKTWRRMINAWTNQE